MKRYLFITCVTAECKVPSPTTWATLDRCIRSLIPDAVIAHCLGKYNGETESSYCVSTDMEWSELCKIGSSLAEMFGQECALTTDSVNGGFLIYPEGKEAGVRLRGDLDFKVQPIGKMKQQVAEPHLSDYTQLCHVPSCHGLYENYSELKASFIRFS